MTVLRSSAAPLVLGRGRPVRSQTSAAPVDWVRPSDWLDLTPPGATEQKFVGLIAVFDQGSNYVALRAAVSSGTYTVDWGDGTSPQTYTSNTTAQYNYAYSSLNANTLSSRGYRQAIVTVTPTTSGATFSLFGLNYRHSARSSTSTVAPWLDVAVSAPNATTLRINGRGASDTTATVLLTLLERATIVSHNTTTMTRMFQDCASLRVVSLGDTSAVTSMGSMFTECNSLRSVPLFDTRSNTTMAYMFDGCVSLESVPLFNTASVTSMLAALRSCSSLKSIPLFNTSSVSTFTQCFFGCTNLEEVPLFNTSSANSMDTMFRDCYSLQAVPLFDTSNVSNMTSMFSGCTSLISIPLFNTAKVTDVSNMVAFCTSLRSIPELNLGSVTSASFNNMAYRPNLGRAKLTGMRWTQSFSGCNMAAAELNEMYTALDKLNPNVTNVTGNGTTVTYTVDDITAFVASRTVTITGVDPVAYNLTNVTVATVSVANSQFTVTNAATGTYVSGGVAAIQDNRTITVTGNPGVTGDDPTIATNKGWTVTG